MTPSDVVREFHYLWSIGEIEKALELATDDCVYRINVSDTVVPFGGTTVGRAAILAAMRETRAVFDYVLYRPVMLAADGAVVRTRTEFIYSHRASGERLTGHIRHVFRVANGRFVEADEFLDAPMAESFLRLFPWQAAPLGDATAAPQGAGKEPA